MGDSNASVAVLLVALLAAGGIGAFMLMRKSEDGGSSDSSNVPCAYSEWQQTGDCVDGKSAWTREVLSGGSVCRDTSRNLPCNDCEYENEFPSWGPCGTDGKVSREFVVKRHAKNGGKPCKGSLVEYKPCNSSDTTIQTVEENERRAVWKENEGGTKTTVCRDAGQKLWVTRANIFCSGDESKKHEVTSKVQQFVDSDFNSHALDFGNSGNYPRDYGFTDPKPGCNKTLEVFYKCYTGDRPK